MNIVNNIFNGLIRKNKLKKEKIEICGDSELPKRGWIQGCYSCNIPTSRMYPFENNIIENNNFTFHVYICKDCKNILNKENFKCSFNEYIINNFLDTS
jgi:hypothetical protein